MAQGKEKQITNILCVDPHDTQKRTNNVNKTCEILHTAEGKYYD